MAPVKSTLTAPLKRKNPKSKTKTRIPTSENPTRNIPHP
jgi:hypothetical protein